MGESILKGHLYGERALRRYGYLYRKIGTSEAGVLVWRKGATRKCRKHGSLEKGVKRGGRGR